MPLREGLPLSQRVWFLLYPPDEERRIANRVIEFEIATKEAEIDWKYVDLTGVFGDWMDTFEPEERQACLENPEVLESYADPGFRDFVCSRIKGTLNTSKDGSGYRTVCAIGGLMDLYDFAHVSAVVEALDTDYPGIVLVFFPGDREGNTYRFLGARTGWDYLAVPITSEC